ncbi:MAG: TIGR03915 family putative DNA repair protein [Anaerococcus sp.]
MKYLTYDGTLEGLFTVVFEFYKDIFKISIEKESDQLDFLKKDFIETDLDKSYRVKKALEEKISPKFLKDVQRNFRSKDLDKENLIARMIRFSFHYGNSFIGSDNKYAIKFRENLKNYGSELHTYKGLVRFSKIQEDFLFSEIAPENDLIMDLALHFLKRMPKEKFIIYDKNRKKAFFSIEGKFELVDVIDLKIEEDKDEKFYKDLWVSFYDSISIKERKNSKLMISNMPKKYWKYLPEKNRISLKKKESRKRDNSLSKKLD